ncbi:Ribosomal L12 domain-containing protein [Citrus sinensis]|uniref:Ribosomal L12 domain-containing protein n=1 Tax=Citrus sinensis TaxID=2711 RepID=A0ACB8JSL2_CITSI|nr:Ribosomal L12 domain-containing protein [Citrus sinensis]
MASEYEFEVMDEKYKTFVVNLQNRTCDCGACHICGIPCKHVTRCIARRHEDVVDYVDWKLTVEAYLATYSDVIHPLLDQITWSIIEGLKILSPKVKVKVVSISIGLLQISISIIVSLSQHQQHTSSSKHQPNKINNNLIQANNKDGCDSIGCQDKLSVHKEKFELISMDMEPHVVVIPFPTQAVSRKPSSSAVGLAVVIVALVRRTRVVVPSLQPDIVVASMLKLFLSWDSGLISQVRCFGMSNCEAFTALLAQPTAVQPTPTLRLTHLTADSLRRRPFASDPAAVASISAITSIPCQSISAETMKLTALAKSICSRPFLPRITGPLQFRLLQHDFVPRDPKSKPIKYKYPAFYDPYGPRPPPSDKVVQLAERIASLTPEERRQISLTLFKRFSLPKLQPISTEGLDLGPQGGAPAGSAKVEEKKEKTTFDVKLEKFEAAAKLKIVKEVKTFFDLGMKEAKELVEKAPVVLKQGLTKEEASNIIEKIKAAGGVAIME